jgi:hypothetical protein
MNERGQKAKHTIARHLQALRLVRARRAIRNIPDSTPLKLARHWQHYAICATAQLGKKRLARVVWPWQARPADPKRPPYISLGAWRRQCLANGPRVVRGRASNPTVLG